MASISTLRGITPKFHLVREDYLPDLWPLCRTGMGSEKYTEFDIVANCRQCGNVAVTLDQRQH